jgi:hypothetical protein
MKKLLKILAFLLSVVYQYWIALAVIERSVNITTLVLWLLSIIFIYYSFPFSKKKTVSTSQAKYKLSRKQLLLLILVIGFAVLIRVYLMLDTNRFHGDEYQTAYFSYNLPKISDIDWFAVYPERGAWVSQFPVLFFVFQKLFFNLFGISTLVIRFSVLPYIIAVFIFLFLSVQRLFDTKTAFLSTFILSVFAPDLYLTSLGLHFISSTAFFLASIYFFLLTYQEGEKRHFAFLGVTLAFCYMTYYSSFIALPTIFVLFFLLLSKKKLAGVKLSNYILAVLVLAYSIAPLTVYATQVDNFFTQRTDQISVFNGEWSQYSKEKKDFNTYLNIAKEQTAVSLRSLYKDGIGGHGGYNFGHLALFDYFTIILFGVGFLYFIYQSVAKRSSSHIFIVSVITLAFFSSMVFTIPPPAYHRFSIAFPFICIIISSLLVKFQSINPQLSLTFTQGVVIAYIAIFCFTNLAHFNQFLEKDGFKQAAEAINNNSKNLNYQQVSGATSDNEYLFIENDIKRFPNKTVFISSFNSYALGRIMLFRFNGEKLFITEGLDAILDILPDSSDTLIIIHNPGEISIEKVRTKFPNMQIIDEYQHHILIKTS